MAMANAEAQQVPPASQSSQPQPFAGSNPFADATSDVDYDLDHQGSTAFNTTNTPAAGSQPVQQTGDPNGPYTTKNAGYYQNEQAQLFTNRIAGTIYRDTQQQSSLGYATLPNHAIYMDGPGYFQGTGVSNNPMMYHLQNSNIMRYGSEQLDAININNMGTNGLTNTIGSVKDAHADYLNAAAGYGLMQYGSRMMGNNFNTLWGGYQMEYGTVGNEGQALQATPGGFMEPGEINVGEAPSAYGWNGIPEEAVEEAGEAMIPEAASETAAMYGGEAATEAAITGGAEVALEASVGIGLGEAAAATGGLVLGAAIVAVGADQIYRGLESQADNSGSLLNSVTGGVYGTMVHSMNETWLGQALSWGDNSLRNLGV